MEPILTKVPGSLGYGRWDAPAWFVGMESGGNDTWTPLVRAFLSFEGRPHSDEDVAAALSDDWGSADGRTAVIELAALRTRDRGRILEVAEHIATDAPRFALFYGRSHKEAYERIAGTFGSEDWVWRGSTLCVLTVHPAYRYTPGPEYWIALGMWLKTTGQAGPGAEVAPCPQPPPKERPPKVEAAERPARAPRPPRTPPVMLEGSEFEIKRGDRIVGRVLYDGTNVRVERGDEAAGFVPIGSYERATRPQFARKLEEIRAVFPQWSQFQFNNPGSVRVVWRAAAFVPAFEPPSRAARHGCSIVEENGVEVARIYKLSAGGAVWVQRGSGNVGR